MSENDLYLVLKVTGSLAIGAAMGYIWGFRDRRRDWVIERNPEYLAIQDYARLNRPRRYVVSVRVRADGIIRVCYHKGKPDLGYYLELYPSTIGWRDVIDEFIKKIPV